MICLSWAKVSLKANVLFDDVFLNFQGSRKFLEGKEIPLNCDKKIQPHVKPYKWLNEKGGCLPAMRTQYEELSSKTALRPYYMFLIFSPLKSIHRLDLIICWFSLYLIADKSIKIFFYENKCGGKVEPHYHTAQILTVLHI